MTTNIPAQTFRRWNRPSTRLRGQRQQRTGSRGKFDNGRGTTPQTGPRRPSTSTGPGCYTGRWTAANSNGAAHAGNPPTGSPGGAMAYRAGTTSSTYGPTLTPYPRKSERREGYAGANGTRHAELGVASRRLRPTSSRAHLVAGFAATTPCQLRSQPPSRRKGEQSTASHTSTPRTA